MSKYIEFGLGNHWLIRTEIENPDGTEYEVKGMHGPIVIRSFYLRFWFRHQVFILDSREGIKRMTKKKKTFKLIFGIHSD